MFRIHSSGDYCMKTMSDYCMKTIFTITNDILALPLDFLFVCIMTKKASTTFSSWFRNLRIQNLFFLLFFKNLIRITHSSYSKSLTLWTYHISKTPVELPTFLFSSNYRSPRFAFQYQHLSSFSAVLMATVKFYKTIFRFTLFNLPI